MASALRCSHKISSRLITTAHRQTIQLNNHGERVLSVVPIYCKNKQQHYHNYQWNWRQFHGIKSDIYSNSMYHLISIGCATVLIYNWKRYISIVFFFFFLVHNVFLFVFLFCFEKKKA